jgi:hypothetical protein
MSLYAMKLALKALTYHFDFDEQDEQPFVTEAIVALRQAIKLLEKQEKQDES